MEFRSLKLLVPLRPHWQQHPVTDYKTKEVELFAFTPHGEIWQESSLDTLPKVEYLFTGKQVDAETG